MFGVLSAGTYRGQIGNRVYGHDTGGSMQGRYIRHAAMGQAVGAAGVHMGGVRLLSVLSPVGYSGGRSVALGSGRSVRLGTIGWQGYAPRPAYVDPVPVVPYTPIPSAIHWQRLGVGSGRIGIMGRRRFW